MPPNTTYPIHRHLSADEWYIVVHGELRIQTYNSAGRTLDTYCLRPPSELAADLNAGIGLLMKSNTFHDTSTTSEGALFVEVRPGPFDKADTQYLSATEPHE